MFGSLMKEIAQHLRDENGTPEIPWQPKWIDRTSSRDEQWKNQWIRSRRIFRTDETGKSKTRQEA